MPISLMNGLSALGTGVSQFAGSAGLELQKSQLQQQSQILADQLATTRETKLQGQQQAFQSGENTLNRSATAENLATTEAGANTRNAATNTTSLATNAATIAGEAQRTAATNQAAMERVQAEINKQPEVFKILKGFGLNPDGTPIAGGTEPSPAAAGTTGASSSGGTATSATDSASAPAPEPIGNLGLVKYPDGSVGTPTTKPSDTGAAISTPATGTPPGGTGGASPPIPAPGSSGAASTAKLNPLDLPAVKAALGYPTAGSEDALRRAVAADVKSDPDFKYKTAGQQAVETELRVNVAKGTMTSPATQRANAALIASYQLKPPDGFALGRQGASETMGFVKEFNPDYQESRFAEVNDVMKRFGAQKEGDQVRYLNVGVQHLSVFDQAAAAIGNGDIQKLNGLSNWFKTNFGISTPTTLAGLKQIVGTEVERAATGGIGAVGDRERIMKSLDQANSPAQLQDMTNGFRSLLAGQLKGLKRQYEDGTGFTKGPFAFENKLDPETRAVLTPAPSNPNIIRYDTTGKRIAP